MSLATTIASDYQYIDGIETVSHKARVSGSTTTGIPALRRHHSKGPQASQWSENRDGETITWHIWKPSLTILVGDTITTAAGVAYLVQSAALESLDQRWRVSCKKGV